LLGWCRARGNTDSLGECLYTSENTHSPQRGAKKPETTWQRNNAEQQESGYCPKRETSAEIERLANMYNKLQTDVLDCSNHLAKTFSLGPDFCLVWKNNIADDRGGLLF
jgi:hypothetical protein